MTCKVLEIYVHVNSENCVYMFDNYVYTFASFPFFGHMYAKISIVHSQMCTIFLLSIYEIMIEIRKFIYAFIRNHLLLKGRVIIGPSILHCTFLPYPQKNFYVIRAILFCTHVRHNLYCTHIHSRMGSIFFVVDIWDYDSEGQYCNFVYFLLHRHFSFYTVCSHLCFQI